MKIIVFAGPSLGEAPPSPGNGIVYLPPAGQNHLLSAVHRLRPEVVVLADCLTWPHMSVLHKEIIWALSQGTRVVGTAAGGALRAAELAFCGMQGHGRVYAAVAAGHLEDDAEVFCAWEETPHGCRRLSEPLVNIRATLEHAEVQALLPPAQREALLAAAQGIYYKERTLGALRDRLVAGGSSPAAADAMIACLREHYVDVQRHDLHEALQKIQEAGFLPEPLCAESMPVAVDDRSAIFRMLYHHDRIVTRDDTAMRLHEIGNFVTTHHPEIEHLTYNAFNRELALILADRLGLAATAAEIEACGRKFKLASGLADDAALAAWLAANDLSPEDFAALMAEEALVRKLQAAFVSGQMFQKNTRPLLDFMRLTQAYGPWRDKAFDRETTLREHGERLGQAYRATDFGDLLRAARSAPLPWSGDIQQAADALGIGARELKMEMVKDRLRDTLILEKVAGSID